MEPVQLGPVQAAGQLHHVAGLGQAAMEPVRLGPVQGFFGESSHVRCVIAAMEPVRLGPVQGFLSWWDASVQGDGAVIVSVLALSMPDWASEPLGVSLSAGGS